MLSFPSRIGDFIDIQLFVGGVVSGVFVRWFGIGDVAIRGGLKFCKA